MNEFLSNPKIEAALAKLLKERLIAEEHFTQEQLASAFQQALACGDFIRYVRAGSGIHSVVVYIPYAREQELEFKIEYLEGMLFKLLNGEPCQEALDWLMIKKSHNYEP